jgi:glycosyltransferase involved in cell wall biosynthesis
LVTPERAPVFSVAIATWNWSAALELALQSVLDQTFADFEVLVVGDACTDDSAEVVASFGDPRLRWHNLEANVGNQWGPNNYAISVARGKYIAYLGHDDLWWPTHLATALATFERTGADMVAAACVLYGPADSGMRAVTGFFPNDMFHPRYFFPPSSMLHRPELARRVGGWLPPEQARVANDVDFVRRCGEAGAKIVATGEFTAFKFNAAWRRNVYARRDVDDQRAFLARMRSEADAFRCAELARALRAAVEDRLLKIEISPEAKDSAAISSEINQLFKGTRRPARPPAVETQSGRRYPAHEGFGGFEWHAVEQHRSQGAFRWSGPGTKSTIMLPEAIDRPLSITVLILAAIDHDVLTSIRLSVNDIPIDAERSPGPDDTWLLRSSIRPDQFPVDDRGELRLSFAVARTWRPLDLVINDDRRWLGIAVGWVELSPDAADATANQASS